MLQAAPEALAGCRSRGVNPEIREAEFIDAGEDGFPFRFYEQGLSQEKSCGAGCLPAPPGDSGASVGVVNKGIDFFHAVLYER